ncbi:MAG: ferredoxin [Rhodobacteraceae bacterium]|nr:ferredoxin [Paracoccaceae bacterium]
MDVFGTVGTEDGRTLALLGPKEPGFWDYITGQPEFIDGAPDPVDQWSLRVIGTIAEELEAEAVFPFGGPPYHPFIRWAQESGRCWLSPVGLLVHDTAGLMVSFRGAVILDEPFVPSPQAATPCDTCTDRPCETACPVSALAPEQSYDVPKCVAYIDSPEGATCRSEGCLVRRACPVSQSYGRVEAQSAHHMRYFAR